MLEFNRFLKVSIFILLLCQVLESAVVQHETQQTRILREFEDLSGDGKYYLSWDVDFTTRIIRFNVVAETLGFVGFGISPQGGMMGADIVIGGVTDGDQQSYFSDRSGIGNTVPALDDQQNWELLEAAENGTHTSISFSRSLDICGDKLQDVAITEDTVKLIWSLGRSDDLTQGHVRRGVYSTNLLDPPMPPIDTSKYDTWTVERTMTMPPEKSSYWCSMHRSPPELREERHVVGFNTLLNSSLSVDHTHHLGFYRCTAPPETDPEKLFGPLVGQGEDCFGTNGQIPRDLCHTLVYGWAVGGKPMFFPEDISFPILEGGNTEFIMMEIHYNNPQGLSNLTFTSAVEVFHIKEKRPTQAAILIYAHSVKISQLIPPKVKDFLTIAHCGPECTRQHVEPAGINFFNVMFHSHLLGRKMKLRHFRDGKELPWIAIDNSYDFDYQQSRQLREEKKLLPGDQLTLECTTDSLERDGITTGGLPTTMEMCQAFIWYYPSGELRFCESTYPEAKILEKYGIESIQQNHIMEPPIVTAPEHLANKTFNEVVDALGPWTADQIAEHQRQVRFTPHFQQSCGRTPIPEGKLKLSYDNQDQFVEYPKIDKEYAPVEQCSPKGSSSTHFPVANLITLLSFIACLKFGN